MIDTVVLCGDFLPKIPDPKNTIETPPAARIERAQRRLAVHQVTEAARKRSSLRGIIVQKLRRALILPDPNVSVIRSNGHQSIVSYLMNVLGWQEQAWIDLGHSLRIVHLITRVMKCRQAKLILDPGSEIAGSIRFLRGIAER